MHTAAYRHTPVGTVVLEEDGVGLCRLALEEPSRFRPEVALGETPLLAEAARQLDAYFAGKRRSFDLPLSLQGTPFQKEVWQALLTIPYGQTCCYGDIAAKVGRPKASRAVGMANHNNPVIIIVPCHRVVGKDGSLTGYGGGLDVKQYLLELEQRHQA